MTQDKQRNPMLLVPLFVIAAAVMYVMLVQPSSAKLDAERKSLRELRVKTERMNIDLKSADGIRTRIKQADEEIARLDEIQLKPLLESYAMRAKSLVGQWAEQAGLVDAEFSDRPTLALPVLQGKAVPAALHARLPVAISCEGDYAAIVSFIMRVERDMPHVTLEALRIVPGGRDPGSQRAEIVFEWPAKGAGK